MRNNTDMKKLLVSLIDKLLEYKSVDNMGIELVLNGTTVSEHDRFASSYEDLINDIDDFTIYFSLINEFELILIDSSNGYKWHKSTISFYSNDKPSDDIKVVYTFKSQDRNITSYEKKSTTMERLLEINNFYKDSLFIHNKNRKFLCN